MGVASPLPTYAFLDVERWAAEAETCSAPRTNGRKNERLRPFAGSVPAFLRSAFRYMDGVAVEAGWATRREDAVRW